MWSFSTDVPENVHCISQYKVICTLIQGFVHISHSEIKTLRQEGDTDIYIHTHTVCIHILCYQLSKDGPQETRRLRSFEENNI